VLKIVKEWQSLPPAEVAAKAVRLRAQRRAAAATAAADRAEARAAEAAAAAAAGTPVGSQNAPMAVENEEDDEEPMITGEMDLDEVLAVCLLGSKNRV